MSGSKITGFQDKRARPRIRPRRTPLDWTLDIATLDLLIAAIAYTAWHYPSLPLTIGTRFNASGQATQTGGRWTIFIMPALAALVCIILWLLRQFPWVANTLVVINERNAVRQYQLMTRLLGWISLSIAGSFALITYQHIQQAQGNPAGIGSFWVALMLVQPIVIVWYLIKSFQEA